jgi:hypothetical protein
MLIKNFRFFTYRTIAIKVTKFDSSYLIHHSITSKHDILLTCCFSLNGNLLLTNKDRCHYEGSYTSHYQAVFDKVLFLSNVWLGGVLLVKYIHSRSSRIEDCLIEVGTKVVKSLKHKFICFLLRTND